MSITVKRAEGYVDFCEDLSLQADWEDAVESLEKARRNPSGGRMAGPGSQAHAAQAVRNIEAQMQAATVRIRIRSLGRKRWQELGAAHPPRPDDAQDQRLGINCSTFFDVVAKEAIFGANDKTTGDVRDFDPKAEWDDLADNMTDGQYAEFVEKFLELNRGVTSAPFSRTASLLTQDSEKTSSSQNDSASPTSD